MLCLSLRAFCLGAITVVALQLTADSAVLLQYQFGTPGQETTNETSSVFNPTITGPNISGTPITDPLNTVGLEASSAATTPPNAPFLRLDPQANSATAAQAVTNNKYFQFTISPLNQVTLDLESLTFDAARGGSGTPRGYVVRSSFDNFATNLAQADLLTVRPAYTPVTVNLSSFADTADPVTFRIYSYSPGAGSSVDYDNITVNGNVIPEPTTGLLLVAGLGICSLRRRRN